MKNRIKVDLDRRIGEIPDTLFGSFIEHLGRCVYGGILGTDQKTPCDEAQIRLDVLEAVKRMKPSILRWPGGNFASGYHWMDGVGPKEERRTLRNLAWGQTESNQFGTDEFISFCRKVGAEPFICTNMGTGTPEEARNWVEYCNGEAGTWYADLRGRNGNPEPFGIRYWGIGNEMNGFWQIGQLSAEDFGKKARETAKLIRWTDPEARLVLAGDCTDDPVCVDYDRTLLDYTIDYIDLYSIHMYARNDDDDYFKYMAYSQRIQHKIDLTNGLIRAAMHRAGRTRPVRLSFDEWNVFYREDSTAASRCEIAERYNLEDALAVSLFLNALINNCDTVEVACQSLLVNAAASIVTSETDCFFQTIFYPICLYYSLRGREAVRPLVQCKTYSAGPWREVPYLDVSVTCDRESGELTVFAVNKSMEEETVEIYIPEERILPQAELYRVFHEDIKAENSFLNRDNVGIETKQIEAEPFGAVCTFPPHSLNVIRFHTEVRK